MKSPYDILIAPIITEQAMDQMSENKYSFRVHPKANKAEIRKAVEEAFDGVKVKKVNTMNRRGKTRRIGYHYSKTSDWKKAVVTLTNDSKAIEFFEGLE